MSLGLNSTGIFYICMWKQMFDVFTYENYSVVSICLFLVLKKQFPSRLKIRRNLQRKSSSLFLLQLNLYFVLCTKMYHIIIVVFLYGRFISIVFLDGTALFEFHTFHATTIPCKWWSCYFSIFLHYYVLRQWTIAEATKSELKYFGLTMKFCCKKKANHNNNKSIQWKRLIESTMDVL